MFTTGRLVFIAFFLIAFISMLVWSYRKESRLNKVHYRKVYRILVALLLFFLVLFLIVKLRRYL